MRRCRPCTATVGSEDEEEIAHVTRRRRLERATSWILNWKWPNDSKCKMVEVHAKKLAVCRLAMDTYTDLCPGKLMDDHVLL